MVTGTIPPAHAAFPIPKELEDAFIKISFEEIKSSPANNAAGNDPMYPAFVFNSSERRSGTEIWAYEELRRIYPRHTIVPSAHINILGYPHAMFRPLNPDQMITNTFFVPLARRASDTPGIVMEQVTYGTFMVAWDKYEFILHILTFTIPMFGYVTYNYLLHDGPPEPCRRLILEAGLFQQALHNEIYVYNQGYWHKDVELWYEIQKADWNDIIMKPEYKDEVKKDVYGFFDSEQIYKELGIAWKRGMIMWGPPGNGKTITVKAIMKDCDAKGFAPLYVKSFQHYAGEEAAMQAVFDKARQMAPCVLIFEDLDALINDRNRSFFLNQMDGISNNDGLLCIGTTNHYDRLDPGLSERPSRFDRKYLFDNPDWEERKLYSKYWQHKLATNKKISFPDPLVDDIASRTADFSFAYLKEAFVAALVVLANGPENSKDFATTIRETIQSLRKQIEKGRPALWSRAGADGPKVIIHGTGTIPKPESNYLEAARAAHELGRRYF
ncbi:P-loop containing nucleoside triphosphate hydrolase protein [Dacryopinax primogenitus]|uniref:p-loop containing nucleoside triphosphate hydrolase protein n=1 Tax=Dacryopinax primogenitus (strain DJM 731) TaxID=1858805 RepID=M5FY74_DACPD|nr:P-loop containing nucleoside triphosphate hydrolase protein [Dacryopinax primogenitus]EJU03011.1 P-loop containing nucleoside triphosphate hydrolase protein [Dacryopinax primogenitus]